MESFHTWAEINLDHLKHNYRVLKRRAGQHTELMPVIKAQAYGCGSEMAAKALQQAGTKYFAVADLDEAIFLRSKGIRSCILNLGRVEQSQYKVLVSKKIVQTTFDLSQIRQLGSWAAAKKIRIPIHLKIDTGMGRLGLIADQIPTAIKLIKKWSYLDIQGIYSHLPRADEKKPAFTRKQIKRFKEIVMCFEKAGIKPKFRHVGNSAGIIRFSDPFFNLSRPGLALYGLKPLNTGPIVSLKPILSLKTKVIMIKDVPANTPISYNHIYRTRKSTRIATLSIGYADGLNRLLSNKGRVLIRGKSFPVVGRITMNFTMVDLGNNKNIRVGDEVVLIGKSKNQEITMQEMADLLGTITYEIQCNISALVPRVYYKANKIVAIKKNGLI